MTTIKFYYCPLKYGDGTIRYRVIYKSCQRNIDSGIKIRPQDWDSLNNQLITPTPKYLIFAKEKISNDTTRLHRIVQYLEQTQKTFTVSDIIQCFKNKTSCITFTEFANSIINQLKQNNHIRTSETYRSTVMSFCHFRNNVMLEDINSDMMLAYENWMRQRGLTMNTCSFYMRILRAIYNRAVEQGLVSYNTPFKYVYTGIDKTAKRAIDLQTIRRLKSLNLTSQPNLSFARDIFLFSFYTRGMSFVDIAFLRKSNLNHNELKYRRRKTNQLLIIHWEKCMQDIVERYENTSTPYLLPIITNPSNERNQYLNASRRINRHLKIIGNMLNLHIPLTMYVARHSWASIARDKKIPVSIICESMGHESEKTTRIYLSSINHHEIDRANRIIIKSI